MNPGLAIIRTLLLAGWFLAIFLSAPVVSASAEEITKSESEHGVTASSLNTLQEQTTITYVRTGDGMEATNNTIEPNSSGAVVLYRWDVIGLPPIDGLNGPTERKDVILVRGKTQPAATIHLALNNGSVLHSVQADSDGDWSATLLAEKLPRGQYTLSMNTEWNGTQSNEKNIAEFVVLTKGFASNTTWISIMSAGIAVDLILLVLVILFFMRKHGEVQEQTPSTNTTQA